MLPFVFLLLFVFFRRRMQSFFTFHLLLTLGLILLPLVVQTATAAVAETTFTGRRLSDSLPFRRLVVLLG
jgi:hypothetical protein